MYELSPVLLPVTDVSFPVASQVSFWSPCSGVLRVIMLPAESYVYFVDDVLAPVVSVLVSACAWPDLSPS